MLAGHAFWEEDEEGSRAGQRTHFLKNLSMLGGLLLAAVDTDGRPSGRRHRRPCGSAGGPARRLTSGPHAAAPWPTEPPRGPPLVGQPRWVAISSANDRRSASVKRR
jgi:hypothetical protein